MTDLAPYITAFCEPGGSHAFGAYIDGHVDVGDFVRAVRDEMKRDVKADDVTRGYYRVLRGIMHTTTTRSRGAKPITWVEWR